MTLANGQVRWLRPAVRPIPPQGASLTRCGGAQLGHPYESIRGKYRDDEPTRKCYSFSSDRKRMSTIVQHDGALTVFTKGAAEVGARPCVECFRSLGRAILLPAAHRASFVALCHFVSRLKGPRSFYPIRFSVASASPLLPGSKGGMGHVTRLAAESGRLSRPCAPSTTARMARSRPPTRASVRPSRRPSPTLLTRCRPTAARLWA